MFAHVDVVLELNWFYNQELRGKQSLPNRSPYRYLPCPKVVFNVLVESFLLCGIMFERLVNRF
jgi:hypothetical protein